MSESSEYMKTVRLAEISGWEIARQLQAFVRRGGGPGRREGASLGSLLGVGGQAAARKELAEIGSKVSRQLDLLRKAYRELGGGGRSAEDCVGELVERAGGRGWE